MQEQDTTNLSQYSNTMRENALSAEDLDTAEAWHKMYMESMDLQRQIDHDGMEYYDKDQRRQLEEVKNADAKELELKKQKIGAPRMCLEILKVLGPVLIAAAVNIRMQNKAGISEEKGTAWKSEVSRMANGQKPNLWKW